MSEIFLNSINMQQCEIVRNWRNKLEGVLRTSFLLTDKMQETFYHNTICNRNSNNRFFGVYLDNTKEITNVKNEKTEMRCKPSIEFIGMVGLINIEWENGIAEISLLLNPDLIGHGYGSKTLHLLLNKGFYQLRLNQIFGEVYKCNGNGLNFWNKQIEKYDAYSTILPARKYFNCTFVDSLYFSFSFQKFLQYNKR